MHNLCIFCTFSTFTQKIFKGQGCNFTWSFDKVMQIKSLKMVFVARITRHKLCMICAFFDFCVQKLFLPKIIFRHNLFSDLMNWHSSYDAMDVTMNYDFGLWYWLWIWIIILGLKWKLSWKLSIQALSFTLFFLFILAL